jgi:hypothetical protein
MITRRVSEALIALAARRWPERLRAEVHREWTGELAVLAEEHRHWRMLRYAASLAAHPAPRPATTSTPVLLRAWHAARLLIVGPLVCVILLVASLIAMNLVVQGLWLDIAAPVLPDWAFQAAMKAQLPLLSLLCLESAWLAARLGRRWAPVGLGTAPLLLSATVPGFVLVSVILSLEEPAKGHRLMSVDVTFFLGLIVLLYFVARRARRRSASTDTATAGRSAGTKAGWLGVVGAFVIADIAVIPAVLSIRMSPEEGAIAVAAAPMWLPAMLTDWGFGLPHPSPAEIFVITDVLVGVPQILMIMTGWALGLMLGAVASEPAAAPAAV